MHYARIKSAGKEIRRGLVVHRLSVRGPVTAERPLSQEQSI